MEFSLFDRPRRRFVVTAGVLSALALALAGCSGTGSSGSTAASGQHYNFQVGAPDPAEEATTAAVMAWAKQVATDTNGAVNITVQANDSLGSDATELAAVQTGSQFGFLASEGDFEGIDPMFSIPDLPYMFPGGADQEKQLLAGQLGQTLDQTLENNNLVSAGWISWGPRSILSKSPVVTPGDVNGLKIRVQPAPSMESGYQKLGADIDPVSFDELYTALQTGAVDAMENSPATIVAHKFYETAKNFSPVEMILTAGSLVLSKQLFDSLPADYQQIVTTDGAKAMGDEWAAIAQDDTTDLAAMQQNGVAVQNVDVGAWQAAVGDAAEEYAQSKGGQTYQLYQTVRGLEQGQ